MKTKTVSKGKRATLATIAKLQSKVDKCTKILIETTETYKKEGESQFLRDNIVTEAFNLVEAVQALEKAEQTRKPKGA